MYWDANNDLSFFYTHASKLQITDLDYSCGARKRRRNVIARRFFVHGSRKAEDTPDRRTLPHCYRGAAVVYFKAPTDVNFQRPKNDEGRLAHEPAPCIALNPKCERG